ncbi:ABC transporter permease [Phreatobacter sp.]|uniref:cell division protein FtsX n=1 Tax=Phreatobacter sp. TaxID=1966341 RepID=UPI0022C9F7D9|nr:ABC transporter permease [Phreatobacter sp.]MCZ8316973.1 ABC transporter permease [Phreatobacter sp.]
MVTGTRRSASLQHWVAAQGRDGAGERAARPGRGASLVPPSSIAGRALMVIIAIMTFLGSLTVGGVDLVRTAAADWTSSIVREATIQVRPVAGRDVNADVTRATEIAVRFPGVADVAPYTAEETRRMLEPWLGTGLGAEDLPIPRLIVVKLADDRRTNMEAFRRALAEVPTASLDDHRQWFDRLRAMARAVIVVGLVIVALMIAATGLSVVFATRAAVETNRPVVEVLHFVGARDAFIAGEFQRHFLWLALKGSVAGGLAALGAIMASGLIAARWRATAGGDQIEALFGSFALGATGYAGIAVLVVLVTAVAAVTCRFTVMRTLAAID